VPLAELLPVPEVVVPDVLDVPDVPDVLEVLAVLDAVLLLVPDVAGVVVELDVPLPYAPVPELGLPEAAPQPARMAAAATNPIPSTQRCITLPIAQHSLSARQWTGGASTYTLSRRNEEIMDAGAWSSLRFPLDLPVIGTHGTIWGLGPRPDHWPTRAGPVWPHRPDRSDGTLRQRPVTMPEVVGRFA
jgi:hypothetical protein